MNLDKFAAFVYMKSVTEDDDKINHSSWSCCSVGEFVEFMESESNLVSNWGFSTTLPEDLRETLNDILTAEELVPTYTHLFSFMLKQGWVNLDNVKQFVEA